MLPQHKLSTYWCCAGWIQGAKLYLVVTRQSVFCLLVMKYIGTYFVLYTLGCMFGILEKLNKPNGNKTTYCI
ncbi:protein of unknown function [Citrobacter freundii]|nr:protein of unknown function [Citrobacter freundii]